jgi:hypothetical protein
MDAVIYTLSDAIRHIGNLVKRFGADHEAARPDGQPGCVYAVFQNGSLVPVCIVGQVFADLGILRAVTSSGITLNEMLNAAADDLPTQGGACALQDAIWSNAHDMGVLFTNDAREYLRVVQSVQDGQPVADFEFLQTPDEPNWGAAEAYGREYMSAKAQEAADVAREDFLRDSEVWQALKATAPAPYPLADAEPMAEWERELLGK